MDNTTTPITPPTTTPTLDPNVVNLAKSIRQQESGGNYQDIGDNGTSFGAYQWQEPTWQAESKQYLGADAPATPLDATPAQQEQVAYESLAAMKNEGLTQKQSASKWNSGDPNAYLGTFADGSPSVGKNAKLGVNYDVPGYVNAVTNNYQSFANNTPLVTTKDGATDTTAQTSGMPTWEKWLLGVTTVGATLGLGFLTGGTADAAIPEEVAGIAGEGAFDSAASQGANVGSSEGILSKAATGVKNAVNSKLGSLGILGGTEGIANTITNNILGNKTATATTNAGNETAQAAENAGTQEANATAQASEQATQQAQNTLDAQEAETQNQLAGTKTLQSTLNQSLNQFPTGKVIANQPSTGDTTAHMATYGYIPDQSTGVNDSTGAIKKANDNNREMSEGVEQVLGLEGARGRLDSTTERAYKNIEKYLPQHEWASAKAHVDEFLGSANTSFGDGTGTLGLDKMERMKREHGMSAGKWDATTTSAKRGAHKALNRGLRDEIAANTKHKDLYNKVMEEEKKNYDSIKILKKLHNKKAPEHKSIFRGALKAYGKYVGTYIGDKMGGPLGAIVGTMVGDHLTKAVDKRVGKHYFESKEGKKLIELASKKSPAAAKTLKNELKKYGVKIAQDKEQGFTMKEGKSSTYGDAVYQAMGNNIRSRKEAQKERYSKKKQEYTEKKKGIMEGNSVKSPYEPYTTPGVIDFGKKATPKNKKVEKGLPTIKV